MEKYVRKYHVIKHGISSKGASCHNVETDVMLLEIYNIAYVIFSSKCLT